MKRTERRQAERLAAVKAANIKMHRAIDVRTPDDWPSDLPYPNRAVRRAQAAAARAAARPEVITERRARSDARPNKTGRAKRVRKRRREAKLARKVTIL